MNTLQRRSGSVRGSMVNRGAALIATLVIGLVAAVTPLAPASAAEIPWIQPQLYGLKPGTTNVPGGATPNPLYGNTSIVAAVSTGSTVPTNVKYEWAVSDPDLGPDLYNPIGTGSVYTTRFADNGHTLRMRVTVSAAGYDDTVRDMYLGVSEFGAPTLGGADAGGEFLKGSTITGIVDAASKAKFPDATVEWDWWINGAVTTTASNQKVITPDLVGKRFKLRYALVLPGQPRQVSKWRDDGLGLGNGIELHDGPKNPIAVEFASSGPITNEDSWRHSVDALDTLSLSLTGATADDTVIYDWNDGTGHTFGTEPTFYLSPSFATYQMRLNYTVKNPNYRDVSGAIYYYVKAMDFDGELVGGDGPIYSNTVYQPTFTGMPEGADYAMQWAFGSPETGLHWDTDQTLRIDPSRDGQILWGRAHLSHVNYNSVQTEWVKLGVITVRHIGETAEFVGDLAIGSTVALNLTLPAGVTTTHRDIDWYVDGTQFVGRGETLTLTPFHAGKELAYTYFLGATGYESSAKRVDVGTVPLGVIDDLDAKLANPSNEIGVGAALEAGLTGAGATDATAAWEWKRGNTVVSTTGEYKPTFADSGKSLTVTGAVTKLGHHPAAVSFTVAIPDVVLGVSGLKKGEAVLGDSLTASAPAVPRASVAYQWRLGSATGEVAGIGATFDVSTSHVGRTLWLAATATDADGSTHRLPARNLGEVVALPNAGDVTVDVVDDGAPIVIGAPIGLDVEAAESETTVEVTWHLGSQNGKKIGTGSTFTPATEHGGAIVVAVIRVSRDGHRDTVRVVEFTVPYAGLAAGSVTLTGRPQVGARLSAKVTTKPAVAAVIEWRVGGKVVGHGTSYTVRNSDAGKRIEVVATVRQNGYRAQSFRATSGVVVAPLVVKLSKATVKAGKKQTITVNAVTPGKTVTVKVTGKKAAVVKVLGNGKIKVTSAKKINGTKAKVKAVGRDGFKVTIKVGKKKAKKVAVSVTASGQIKASTGYSIGK